MKRVRHLTSVHVVGETASCTGSARPGRCGLRHRADRRAASSRSQPHSPGSQPRDERVAARLTGRDQIRLGRPVAVHRRGYRGRLCLPQHHELGPATHRVDSAVASGRSPAAQRQFRLPQRRRCTTPTRRSSPAPRPSLPEHGRAVLPQNLPVNNYQILPRQSATDLHIRGVSG